MSTRFTTMSSMVQSLTGHLLRVKEYIPNMFKNRLSLLLQLSFSTICSATPLPQLQYSVSLPTPTPTYPAAFDTFTPPWTITAPYSQTPGIAELTRTAQPDQTVIIAGHDLSQFTGTDAGKDTRFRIYGQTTSSNATLCDGSIQRLAEGFAHVTLPDTLPASSLYLIWPENEDGAGYPRMINHPHAWWVGPKTAYPGDTVSVFGRNLSHDNGTTDAWIYLTDGATGMWLTPTAVSPNRVSFTIPTTLSVGTYEVWAHNGHGGDLGWSEPLDITVELAPDFDGGTTYDVTSFGAVGDGVTDDTDAINAAILATRTTGATYSGPVNTLYFPAGVYMISDVILSATRLHIRGAGMDQTIIRKMPGFTGYISNSAPTYARYSDLTFDANGEGATVMILHRFGYDIHYTNVRFSAQRASVYAYPIDIHQSERVFFNGCEIIGSGTQLLSASQVFMDDTTFKGTTGAFWLLHMRSGHDVSITNSTVQHLDNTSPDNNNFCSGRFITADSIWGTMRNIHIDGNTTIDLTPSATYWNQNAGEQIMWEEATTHFYGNPISATATTVTLNSATASSVPLSLMITTGKGCGQFREIIGIDTTTGIVTVDKPWDVIPDSSSLVTAQFGYSNIVIANNSLDFDTRSVTSTSHIASTGIQPYSGSCNLIIDSNTIHEARSGISLWTNLGTNNPPTGESAPCFFPLVTNNTIDTCRVGLRLTGSASDTGHQGIGRMFRGNSVTGAVDYAINIRSGPNGTYANNIMTVFEHNTVTDSAIAFEKRDDNGPMPNVLFYKNTFTLGTAAYAGSTGLIIDDVTTPAFSANTFSGFETTYDSSLLNPDEISEIPLRVYDTSSEGDNADSAIELWNSGIANMSWTATSNMPWLKVNDSSGTVVNQNDSDLIAIAADPSGLPDGDYIGEISINTGSQTKKVSVNFNLLRTGVAADTVVKLRLDDGPSGVTALDASGDGNHGTLEELMTWTTDTPTGTGYAVQNTAANDAVLIEHNADLDLDNNFTIAFWLKASPISGWPRLFGHRDSSDGIEIQNRPGTNDVSVLFQTSAGSNQLKTIPGVLTGDWEHIAITVASGTLKIYINGTLNSTENYSHGNGLGNSEDIALGGRSKATGGYVGAKYDYLTIVNVVLTDSQINTLYQENQP